MGTSPSYKDKSVRSDLLLELIQEAGHGFLLQPDKKTGYVVGEDLRLGHLIEVGRVGDGIKVIVSV